MKPVISDSGFGYITVEGSKIDHDIIIRLSGEIKKRKKKLSKAIYGTSHIISLEEAKYVYQNSAERLIIGTGHQGMVNLSDEAAGYLKKKKCKMNMYSTPKAIEKWNDATERVIGLFHITC
ncbi:MAG: MTH938/NDUFAF3 family protein [Bacteroidales bacterium]|nr:MTH938/NDUFAF3 family protein [Bacteroidales bacterium]